MTIAQPTSSNSVKLLRDANLRNWLDRGASAHPNKFFLKSIDQEKTATYGEVHEFCRRLSRWLREQGFDANDRVALISNNALEHLLFYFGVMYYGATICTIHVGINAGAIQEILETLDPKLVVFEENVGLELEMGRSGYSTRALGFWSQSKCSGIFADIVKTLPQDLARLNKPDDIATIFFTSGTTAKPKGILCTFRHLETNVSAVTEAFDIRPEDLLLDYRSFNWASAQMLSALGVLCRGATLLLAQKFSSSRFFDWIESFRPTVVVGNPTVFKMLLSRDHDAAKPNLSSVRFMTSSSAPLDISDWKSFEERFSIPIIQGYGSSEAGWIGATSLEERRVGSVGKPLAYHRLSIIGEDGVVLSAGEIGHIELGAETSREYGYLKGDGSIDVTHVGRLRTGDLGYLDEEGYLFITGRAKDLIIRGGINISPMEIDHVISQLPGISEVASVGVPDDIYGEEVAAFVVINKDVSPRVDEILHHCRTYLVEIKVPKSIHIINALPRNERGKLNRKALKELWLELDE